MSIRRTFRLVAGLAGLHLATSAPLAGTVVATGQQDKPLNFHRPQATEGGLAAVIERVHETSDIGGTFTYRDVILMDLRATRAHDILREVTHDGVSSDPSISNSGGAFVYFRASGGTNHLIVATPSGSERDVIQDPNPVSNLDIFPSAVFAPSTAPLAVYKRTVGALEEVVRVTGNGVLTIVDQAPQIVLADERPVDAGGTVYYSKPLGVVLRGYQCGSPSGCMPPLPGPQLITADAGAEERGFSATPDGLRLVYARKDLATAVTNVFLAPPVTALTNQVNPAATFRDIGIAAGGGFALFGSSANLTGGNGDGSLEVFRVNTQTMAVEQVTSGPVPPATTVVVSGISSDAGGSLILHGHDECAFCDTIDKQQMRVIYESLGVTPPTPVAAVSTIQAPFEVRTDIPITPPAEPCQVNAGLVTCDVSVRNSHEATRTLLLLPSWALSVPGPCSDTSVVRPPIPVTLGPGQQVTVHDELQTTCTGASGYFRVDAIGPEVAQADRARGQAAFLIP